MNEPVKNREDIIERLRSAKHELLERGVTGIGLFGSFSTGQQSATSDIDILVEFNPDCHTFDNFMDLSFLLEELFGRRVDLVTFESLSPYIGPRILEEVEYVSELLTHDPYGGLRPLVAPYDAPTSIIDRDGLK